MKRYTTRFLFSGEVSRDRDKNTPKIRGCVSNPSNLLPRVPSGESQGTSVSYCGCFMRLCFSAELISQSREATPLSLLHWTTLPGMVCRTEDRHRNVSTTYKLRRVSCQVHCWSGAAETRYGDHFCKLQGGREGCFLHKFSYLPFKSITDCFST